MLTEIKAYSSWESAPTLLLADTGRAETDLVQIRNIRGLEPVKATIGSSPLAVTDGVVLAGSNVQSRNIVLTIHPNPNWDTWTYEGLRRLLYSYFMPKLPIRLVFYSDDLIPVQIEGVVESVDVDSFSDDLDLIVSIICPDPYFTALNPTVITGQTIAPGGNPTTVSYIGTIATGFQVEASSSTSDPTARIFGIQVGDPALSYFDVEAVVDSSMSFEMNSIPMQKMVQNINLSTGVITNLLSKVREGSIWPTLKNGDNDFSVVCDVVTARDWELTYYARFGGL